MVKRRYIRPLLHAAPLDTEQMVANTPMTSGLNNGDGTDGNYGQGKDDDGSGGENWGDVKAYNLWDDMW